MDELINVFKSLELDLRLDDLLGKLHIVLLKLLLDSEANKVLIIDDVGFTSTSINFLESNFNNIMPRFKNKSIIILDRGKSDSQGFQLLI
ncbi:hypothetical protein [Flavobacterium sp. HTF]|uniref:hypothetical protein n=1 Tax=Flavobacterium sp. HTF TaxID=2170732 RepID=UPI000D5F6388|nr:hypothetical protein [Flavobacterium sp. HTF]PWB26431.1 hypothetical protein DCO46_06390 [Flavobacterium sp. HTF]